MNSTKRQKTIICNPHYAENSAVLAPPDLDTVGGSPGTCQTELSEVVPHQLKKTFSGVTLGSVPGPHTVCFAANGEIMSGYQKIFTPLLCTQPLVVHVFTSV